MPSKAVEENQASLTLRRRELLAKYPDAVLLKVWMMEEAERRGVKVSTIRNKLTRGQLQPRMVSLNSHEKYVVL